MVDQKLTKGAIVIYHSPRKGIELRIRLKKNTIWLNTHQMAQIFDVNRPAIVKHINNIYKTGELDKKSTCSILEQVAADGKKRKMNFYNLDMIIAVGYRVNSKRATQFRIWATNILKQYILQGYALNEKRLLEIKSKFNELKAAISFLKDKIAKKQLAGQEKEILDLLAKYTKTLTILGDYDKNKFTKPKGKKPQFVLQYEDCLRIIKAVKKELMAKKEATDLFGKEYDGSFARIIQGLGQSFGGKEIYKTIEEKAAHLLYLIIKDHPFVDGNKRIGSFLFVYFLDRNDYLYYRSGERKISDNALIALALLIAASDPKEKELLIKIIVNLLTGH